MAHCKRLHAIVVTTKDDALLARLRCKQWDCQYCSGRNRAAWRKAIYTFLANNPSIAWSFHTFTMPKSIHANKDVQGSVHIIKKYWQRLMQRLQRKYGKFEYVRVVEMHKSGIPHIHLMAGFRIPKEDLSKHKDPKKQYIKWLKKALNSKELPFGYIVNNQNATGKDAQITKYITAYMTKAETELYDLLKLEKMRIVQTSRGIKSPLSHSESEQEWVMRLTISGLDILARGEFFDLNKKKSIGMGDLSEDGYYPDYLAEVDTSENLG